MSSRPHFSIHSMELGPMENFVYCIHDAESNRLAVVDPAWEVDKIIAYADSIDARITDILLTHSHHDHVNGVEQLLNRYDCQLHLLKSEAKFWGQYESLPTAHHGGDVIELGATHIELLHTPGHTPGSTCYHVHGNLITGDTLFVWGCGRCDLRGGDPEAMFHTLKKITEHYPSDTRILPGHNYSDVESTSLQEQLRGNPFLHFSNIAEFVHYRMHEHDRIRNSPYHAEPKA